MANKGAHDQSLESEFTVILTLIKFFQKDYFMLLVI